MTSFVIDSSWFKDFPFGPTKISPPPDKSDFFSFNCSLTLNYLLLPSGTESPTGDQSHEFAIRFACLVLSDSGGWVDLSSGAQGTTLILSVPLSGPENGFIDALGSELGTNSAYADLDPDDPTVWSQP